MPSALARKQVDTPPAHLSLPQPKTTQPHFASQISSPEDRNLEAQTTPPGNTCAVVPLALGLAALSCVILVSQTEHAKTASMVDSSSATELGAMSALHRGGDSTVDTISFKVGKDGKYCGYDDYDGKMKCSWNIQHDDRTTFDIQQWRRRANSYTIKSRKSGKWCSLTHDRVEIKCQDPTERRTERGVAVSQFDFADQDGKFILTGNMRFRESGYTQMICSGRGNDGVKCYKKGVDSWERFSTLSAHYNSMGGIAATELKGDHAASTTQLYSQRSYGSRTRRRRFVASTRRRRL
jgi:hypothetical protein